MTRYTAKLKEKRLLEIVFPENEDALVGFFADDFFEKLFFNEIENAKLQQTLSCLRDRERSILLQHILNERSLKVIAIENAIPYPTVKSLYLRSLEKLRKEMSDNEI